MKTGSYVHLFTPAETAEYKRDRPGMIVIGSDGGGELLTIDLRSPNSPVSTTPAIGCDWEDSIQQKPSIAAFIAAIEERSFEFRLEPDRG